MQSHAPPGSCRQYNPEQLPVHTGQSEQLRALLTPTLFMQTRIALVLEVGFFNDTHISNTTSTLHFFLLNSFERWLWLTLPLSFCKMWMITAVLPTSWGCCQHTEARFVKDWFAFYHVACKQSLLIYQGLDHDLTEGKTDIMKVGKQHSRSSLLIKSVRGSLCCTGWKSPLGAWVWCSLSYNLVTASGYTYLLKSKYNFLC